MQQLLKISDLVFDANLYPRVNINWITVLQYAEAMDNGAKFPDIDVGILNGKQYVVDGWHRIKAYEKRKVEYVRADVTEYKTEKDFFIACVNANIANARPFSVQERVRIIDLFEKYGIEKEEIKEILKMSVNVINRFKARTIIGPNGQAIYQKSIEAKTGLVHSIDNQSILSGSSIKNLMDQLVIMLGDDCVFLSDTEKEVASRLIGLLEEKISESIGVTAVTEGGETA